MRFRKLLVASVILVALLVFNWHNLRDHLIFTASFVVDLEQRELQRRKYLDRLELFASEMPKEKEGVVFLGDSLTSYYDLGAFFPGANAVNRGIAGDTTVGILNRLDKSLSRWQGRTVFLMIGYNDLKYRRAGDVLINMKEIIGNLVSKGVPPENIVIQSVLPVDPRRTWVNAEIRKINQGLAALAKETGCDYLDLHRAFIGADEGVNNGLALDGVHLSERGYGLWTSLVLSRYAEKLAFKGGVR